MQSPAEGTVSPIKDMLTL